MVQTAISKTIATYELGKNTAKIEKRVPIAPNLIEAEFLQAILDVWFSAQIIWNTIILSLPSKEAVTPPLPTPHMEEPPPTPAS